MPDIQNKEIENTVNDSIPELSPVKEAEHGELRDAVYSHIKNMILTQELKWGERISEVNIAEQLNVSRTPIRDALRRLSNEGIVVLSPKTFARVITFDQKDLTDMGSVRVFLDTLSAQLAIKHGSNAEFETMLDLADKCIDAARQGDFPKRVMYDSEFHLQLVKISKNEILLKFQQELYLKVHMLHYYHGANTIEKDLKLVELHHPIVDALLKRDQDLVLNLIHSHLSDFYGLSVVQNSLPILDQNSLNRFRKQA